MTLAKIYCFLIGHNYCQNHYTGINIEKGAKPVTIKDIMLNFQPSLSGFCKRCGKKI